MPCPHFSPESGECTLLDNAPEDEEDPVESPLDESVNRDWCLAAGEGYRRCPIFRRLLDELTQ